jgi:HSP20 family protein
MFDIITNRKRNRNFFALSNLFSDILPDNLISNHKIMKLDIKEMTNDYQIVVELPGVDRENINLSVTDEVLTISVEKSEAINEENTKYIRKERKFGSYSRSFSIPNIDAEQISANYHDGVLIINIPKNETQPVSTKIINVD